CSKIKFRVMLLWGGLAVAAAFVHAAEPLYEDQPRYFYRGLTYGSDAVFSPVGELINGALGILQVSTNWETLDKIDLQNGLDITWRSITHPVKTVDSYGWRDFLLSEVVPGRFRWNNLQYIPNYHLHLIGGGARHRAFVEWYDAYDFPRPGAWAAATSILHAFLVEAVEHNDESQVTVDPVADMLIFDPAGALLFSSERVSRFFAQELNMSIWSSQPMYNPVSNSAENAGQNYAFHYFFAEGQQVGVFQYWGMSDLLGLTVRNDEGFDWSVGVGGVVEELHEEGRGNGLSAFYARLKWDSGIFIHQNGSLLASLQVSESWAQRFRLNIYPGLIQWHGLSPGIYLGVRDNDVVLGVNVMPIPVGLAVSQ
ncbi:MAG: hypothetical protein ABIA59_00755, partial [Candidatus Latescibacterota bacterium]